MFCKVNNVLQLKNSLFTDQSSEQTAVEVHFRFSKNTLSIPHLTVSGKQGICHQVHLKSLQRLV